MSKEIEDIGAPSRKILQAFVLWGRETCSYKRLENSPTFSCGVISSIVFNKSLLNLAV